MWHVQKSDLEKMSGCVCVCIKTSKNWSFCISGITLPIELKFGVLFEIWTLKIINQIKIWCGPSFDIIFDKIDIWIAILWRFEVFEKDL